MNAMGGQDDLEVPTVPEPCEHGQLGQCEDCANAVVATYERRSREPDPAPCQHCGKMWSPLGCCPRGSAS